MDDDVPPKRRAKADGAQARDPGPLTVWGLTHIEQILRTRPSALAELLIDEQGESKAAALVALARSNRISCRPARRQELLALGGPEARLAVARLKPFAYVDLADLAAAGTGRRFLVAVDCVTDPGNLGSIIRSAVFFGASGLILSERNCAGMTSAVVRRSAGAVFALEAARVTNLVRALDVLKKEGWWIYGSCPGKGTPLAEERFAEKSCLVLGSEDKGLRPLVQRQCDVLLSLSGDFESLNVANFASVMFYQWCRSR
jgi:23S rRNA (guanosine2251-2'-O)-methyltransferase